MSSKNYTNKVIGSSMVLFLDQILVAITNWGFWLIISKSASTSQIGEATTVYNLVLLVSTLTQLGLEYPLLKKSSIHRSQTLGTTLGLELVIALAAIPFMIYVMSISSHHSLVGFTWIATMMLVLYSVGFVARFALLGISDVKTVLFIDIAGVVIRFVVAFILVSIGYGAIGLLIGFLFQFLLVATAALIRGSKAFEFKLGTMKYVCEILREGLVNMPAKLARTFIFSLIVVLLASFGINSSEIGIFYVALMISISAGSLVSSMSYMVIPASSMSKGDLSSGSVRLGLSLTAPIIAALIVAPTFILSLIGQTYVSAGQILIVLSISILPSSIVMTAISRFNNLSSSRKIMSIGSIQISSFLVAFCVLVPNYGTLGAAFSMLLSFILSALLTLVWSERQVVRYVASSGAAIIAGIGAGYAVKLVLPNHPLAALFISVIVTLIVVLALKNTSAKEIMQIVRTMGRRDE